MKWIALILVMAFFCICAYYFYNAYQGEKHADPALLNSDEYKLAIAEAVAEARKLRFIEFSVAVVLFVALGFGLAYLRLPRPSWLRNTLAGFVAFLLAFVIFAMAMEAVLHGRIPNAALPLSAMPAPILYGLAGVLVTTLVFFATERFHVWRVGK